MLFFSCLNVLPSTWPPYWFCKLSVIFQGLAQMLPPLWSGVLQLSKVDSIVPSSRRPYYLCVCATVYSTSFIVGGLLICVTYKILSTADNILSASPDLNRCLSNWMAQSFRIIKNNANSGTQDSRFSVQHYLGFYMTTTRSNMKYTSVRYAGVCDDSMCWEKPAWLITDRVRE